MLPARAGQVAGSRHRDRPAGRKLVEDDLREALHRVGQEDGLGADAHEIAAFGESGDDLSVDPVVRLKARRGRWQQGIASERLTSSRPGRLL